MTIQEGDKIPSVSLKTMTSEGPKDITTEEIFSGKTVAFFSVPGAFTPTCSASHLPSYINNAAALRDKGVDSIVCMSVNDAFVMGAWGDSQGAGDDVLMLADGNGDLAKALDLELDGSGFGLGMRSQRFSFIAKDGVVDTLNVEGPGEYKVSSAEHMLTQL